MMGKYLNSDAKHRIVFHILINIFSGLSTLYYLVKIDQQFISGEKSHYFVLAIFAVKFIMDMITFKIGFASFSLVLLFLPVISILGFGPTGEVQPLFNGATQLIDKHFSILAFSSLFFYCIWSLLLLLNKKSFAHYDSEILKYFLGDSNSILSTWFFSCTAIVSSIIYLPDLPGPGKGYHDLSDSLLPGNAWNSVVVISYFFVLIGVKNSHIRKAALVFVPLWLLSHYARVDILGLILIMYILITNSKKGKVFKSKISFKQIALITVGILSFSYLGLVRHTGLIFDINAILDSVFILINYPTVQDVIYSSAAAIEVTQNSGNLYTLINYISQLVPSFFGLRGTEGAAHLVADAIHTNYGLLIYGEYYLNYNIIGVIAAPFLTYAVLFVPVRILKKLFGNLGSALGYYLIVTAMPRILWYGYIYYLKPLAVIVPVFIIMHLVIVSLEKELTSRPALK